jgi:putative acetyltransferase
MPVTLEPVDHPTPEVRELVGELEVELGSRFEAHQRHGLSLDRIFQSNILFFIARLNGAPVGCGGIAFEDGFAEVKRMYVRPHARSGGLGQAILARLEYEARSRGYTRLTLETGDVLTAAIRLYERAGFKPCPPFGDYARLPGPNIERSRFFEKSITPTQGIKS